MKRLFFAIAIISSIVFCACSQQSKTNASKKGISIAAQAVDVLDGYLDGSVKYESASDQLDELYHKMDYASEYHAPMSDEEMADWLIHQQIIHASHQMTMDNYKGSAETYDSVIEARNEIAVLAGKNER